MSTEKEIQADKQKRIEDCTKEIETVLTKYELGLTAEDQIGAYTKINLQIRFVDLKKYDSPIAQPVNPVEQATAPVGDMPVIKEAEVKQ